MTTTSISSPKVRVMSAWVLALVVVGGLATLGLIAADLPRAALAVLAPLAALVSLICAGGAALAVRARMTQAPAAGCGACGQSCLKGGSGSVDSRACSSAS